MQQYLDLLQRVLDEGVEKGDRTGTGTLSVFGHQMRFDLADGLPAGHHQEGSTRARCSASCCGSCAATPTSSGSRTAASRSGTSGPTTSGDLGPVYGYQWRSWPTPDGRHIDQIGQVVDQIRRDPDSRRHIVSAWNVADIPQMALAPCHAFFQFYVADGPAQLPALPAQRRRLPRRAVQHRVVRPAHPHGRPGDRPGRRRLRAHARRRPPLQQPPRPGPAPAHPRARGRCRRCGSTRR